MNNWQPASTPPQKGKHVLTFSDEGGISLGYFSDGRWLIFGIQGLTIRNNVLQWMELPEPP